MSPLRSTLAVATGGALLIAGATAPAIAADPVMATFHVAPEGDGSACTTADPCAIETALAAARAVPGPLTGDLVVAFAAGDYRLEDTIELTAADSGRDGHRLRLVGGGEARLSGGVDLTTGWSESDPELGIWSRDAEGLDFRQLYVDEDRAIRARTPNLADPADGGPYLTAVGANPATRTYRVPAADLPDFDLSDVEFISTSWWYQNILRIDEVQLDGAEAVLSFAEPESSTGFGQSAQYYDDSPYRFEGALELLDAPGEWHLDREAGALHYLPRAGETMNATTIVAPRLETLVRVAGDATAPVHDISIEGLGIEHGNWTRPSDKGLVTTQAVLARPVTIETGTADPIPGAVEISYAESITIADSRVALTGAHGIQVVRSSHDIAIVSNELVDIAGNAVHLDAYSKLQPEPEERTRGILVGNNTISRYGRDYANGMGIAAFYVSGSVFEHNLISDGYYTGIQIGFQQRAHLDGGSGDNKVRYNEIHHTNRLLSDGGGIYTLGRQLGTEIHGNYVHDILRGPSDPTSAPLAGIYFDNYTEFATARDNVLQNVNATIHRQTGVGARSNPSWGNVPNDAGIIAGAGPVSGYAPGGTTTRHVTDLNAVSLPAGWSDYLTAPAGSVGTVATTPAGNRALEIAKTTGTGTAAALLDFGAVSGRLELDASFVLDDTSSWKALAYLHAPGYVPGLGTPPAISLVAQHGQLSAYDGTGSTSLVPLTAGTQYSVKVVADTDAQSYRVYVNGTQQGGTLPFRSAAAELGWYYTGLGAGHAGSYRVDSVAVTSPIP